MKASKFVALAFALLGFAGKPAEAAPIDYFLTIPLFTTDNLTNVADLTIRGTLSYDGDDAMTGDGNFTIGDNPSEDFAGFTFVMDLGTPTVPSTGVLFDGFSDAGSELYLNFATGAGAGAGTAHHCVANGCAFYSTNGATLSLAQTAPIGLPGSAAGVSPVPLPPAVSLFGSALMMLAGAGAVRRAKRQARAVMVQAVPL